MTPLASSRPALPGLSHQVRFTLAPRTPALAVALTPLESRPFAVTGDSLAGDVLLSADGGRYRSTARSFEVTEDAIHALTSGDVAAAFAEQGELQAALQRATDELLADATVARVMQQHGVKDRRP